MDFNSEFEVDPAAPSKRLAHPGVTLCHIAFRSTALFLYLFASYFPLSFTGVFVSVVLLLSVDFWTVKNVTGRIMVGLRWWNYIDDEGHSQWMFESRNSDSAHMLSAPEIRIFWSGLVAAPALWLIFLITALMGLKLQWMVLVMVGLTLTTSNLLGYMRCRLGHSQSLSESVTEMTNSYMKRQMFANLMSAFSRKQPPTSAGGSNI